MFLDDKLYQHTIQKKINNGDDFKDLINELYRICEDHWKPKFHPGMTYAEGKVEIDRVFNAWDLFIKRLTKEKYFLTDFIAKHSYKSAFMDNPEIKRIYELGK